MGSKKKKRQHKPRKTKQHTTVSKERRAVISGYNCYTTETSMYSLRARRCVRHLTNKKGGEGKKERKKNI